MDYYLSLIQRSSATEVNDGATAICASQTCKNRMRGYMDYLINCRVENILMDDNDDDVCCTCVHINNIQLLTVAIHSCY